MFVALIVLKVAYCIITHYCKCVEKSTVYTEGKHVTNNSVSSPLKPSSPGVTQSKEQ